MYKLLSILSVLIIISTVPFVSSEVIRGESTVPDWVKNTAGWWASEQISDSAFLQGIQYLIKEGIMIVEIPTEIDSEAAEEVPGWVKNTAGWWAEDKIHDTTFVSGIEYLIGKGIIVVEQEVEESVEEVVEIKDFYMEVNSGSCSYCLNWAYVGEKYYFQIETQDSQHGKYIDDVKINAKIISKDGELRHDFGEVAIDDGVYRNNIIIPSMDWYAENILSVTGEYGGVEKTIEKEFEVYGQRVSTIGGSGGGSSGGASTGGYGGQSSGLGGGGCAHVGPVSVSAQEVGPQGIAFSKSGTKMFIVGIGGDDVNEYTLNGAYCIGTATFVDSFSVSSQDSAPTGVTFDASGMKMFIAGSNGKDINEYKLTAPWDVSTASFVDSFSVSSQEATVNEVTFDTSGTKMFIAGSNGKEVNQYKLTAPWDVSTASFVDFFSVSTQHTNPQGLAFGKSGTKMYIVGSSSTSGVSEYTLSSAWNVSSASFERSFLTSSQESQQRAIWFGGHGKTMFQLGLSDDNIDVYKLTAPWNISSASHVP